MFGISQNTVKKLGVAVVGMGKAHPADHFFFIRAFTLNLTSLYFKYVLRPEEH